MVKYKPLVYKFIAAIHAGTPVLYITLMNISITLYYAHFTITLRTLTCYRTSQSHSRLSGSASSC